MSVSAPAYPLFDIQSDEPWQRTSTRAAARSGGDIGPVAAREIDSRPIRSYEITRASATPLEVRRLRDLYAQTRFGVLPMRYVHPEDGTVYVAFADPKLVWRQLSSRAASFTVRLVEVLGA